jgi:phosphoribosylanthranilate isomerase
VKVKICGIRTLEDARAALDAGAWALGFVFHGASKRSIAPDAAAGIVRKLPAGTLTVGVFVDRPLEEVNAVVREVGLRAAQLHGNEDAEYASSVVAETVIKAFRVGDGFDPEAIRGFPSCRVLLDAFHPRAPGGTGTTFDWRIARRAGEIAPVILAGGIHPGNVVEAIRGALPDAIDVSSGVESSPGVKDAGRIEQLFRAVREYEESTRA